MRVPTPPAPAAPTLGRHDVPPRARRDEHGSRLAPVAAVVFAATLAFALGGCALPSAPPADPGAFVEPPAGTVTRFERIATGSLAPGPARFEWTHGRQTWDGRTVFAAVSPQFGSQLHDPVTHALVATLGPDGATRFVYDPPLGLRFPLVVGQGWDATTTVRAPGLAPLALAVRFDVEAREEVDVPAGRFTAYRVRVLNSLGDAETVWTTPALGLGVVRRVVERAATHPAGPGRQETRLVERTLPPAR
jgi:hypothetical protein